MFDHDRKREIETNVIQGEKGRDEQIGRLDVGEEWWLHGQSGRFVVIFANSLLLVRRLATL